MCHCECKSPCCACLCICGEWARLSYEQVYLLFILLLSLAADKDERILPDRFLFQLHGAVLCRSRLLVRYVHTRTRSHMHTRRHIQRTQVHAHNHLLKPQHIRKWTRTHTRTQSSHTPHTCLQAHALLFFLLFFNLHRCNWVHWHLDFRAQDLHDEDRLNTTLIIITFFYIFHKQSLHNTAAKITLSNLLAALAAVAIKQ